jgi:hypothetical protein
MLSGRRCEGSILEPWAPIDRNTDSNSLAEIWRVIFECGPTKLYFDFDL